MGKGKKMKVGDVLDASALGHTQIDVKGILMELGYVMPQGSIAKLPLLPGEVMAKITAIKASQEQYKSLDELKTFECQFCKANNASTWRKEFSTDAVFLCCGECQTVVEVR